MNINTEAAQLTRALGYSEFGMADMLHELSKAQKVRVAEFVRKHEFLPAAQALYVNPAELEQLLVDSGYAQCDECEEWFPTKEMIVRPEVSDVVPEDDGSTEAEDIVPTIRCAGCDEEYS